jgi:hypothetical protein
VPDGHKVWRPVDPPNDSEDYLEEQLQPRRDVHQVLQREQEERPTLEEHEEQEGPQEEQGMHPQQEGQEVQEELRQAHQEVQAHPQQEAHEGPQEQEEPAPPREREDERRLREQAEGRMRVRELVRSTIGGRREQDRQRERIRTTIDWGMERERRRTDDLRRREEPEVVQPAVAEEPEAAPGTRQEAAPVPEGRQGERERLGGTSKTPHTDEPRRRAPPVHSVSIRSRDRPVVRPKPAPDIDGRLVSESEIVRYDTSRPGSPEVRWELATVTRMTKGLQVKNPTYYNVRLTADDRVSKSVELLADGTWQVWREGRWWPPGREKPAPDLQGRPHL